MISLPGFQLQQQRQPMPAGVAFPHGRGGRNVPVYLLTKDSLKAQALGMRLQEWGAAPMPNIIASPSMKTAIAINPFAEKKFEPMFKCVTFPIIKYGDEAILLETEDRAEIAAFAKWLTDAWAQDKKAKQANKKVCLEDLADAGEIETIN